MDKIDFMGKAEKPFKRCKHDGRVTYKEETHEWLSFHFESDKLISDHSHFPFPTGAIVVECHDCGMVREFGPKCLNYPKWVQRIIDLRDNLE